MATSFLSLVTASVIFTAGLASFIIFILALREKKHYNHIHNIFWSVLLQWSLAFFLIIWIKIPTFLASAGVTLVISQLTSFFAVAIIARVGAYLLFYRGMMTLLKAKKFWLNSFPLLIFIILTPFILSLIFIYHFQLAQVGNILRPFHYAIILFLIAIAVRFLKEKSLLLLSKNAQIGLVLFIIGWLVFLFSDIQIALGYVKVPAEFWFLTLVSSPNVSIGFSIAHVLILIAIVLISHHRYKPVS